MKNENHYFRYILLYYFLRRKNAVKAHKKLCNVHGTVRIVSHTFGNFDVNEGESQRRSGEVDDDKINTFMELNRSQTTRNIDWSLTCRNRVLKPFKPTLLLK